MLMPRLSSVHPNQLNLAKITGDLAWILQPIDFGQADLTCMLIILSEQ